MITANKRLSDKNILSDSDEALIANRKPAQKADGTHWGQVQLFFGPMPITQAVVALYQ